MARKNYFSLPISFLLDQYCRMLLRHFAKSYRLEKPISFLLDQYCRMLHRQLIILPSLGISLVVIDQYCRMLLRQLIILPSLGISLVVIGQYCRMLLRQLIFLLGDLDAHPVHCNTLPSNLPTAIIPGTIKDCYGSEEEE